MKTHRVMVVAGEASGDALAGGVMAELGRQLPLDLVGLGGVHLMAAGLKSVGDVGQTSRMGTSELISGAFPLARVVYRLVQVLRRQRPDLLLLVDYGGLNLPLAKLAHQLGIPVIYYIPPKVWAWGRWRLDLMARWVDRVLVMFPWELDIYENARIPASYVGHPAVDVTHSQPDGLSQTVALLPGSRHQEVDALWPKLVEASLLLRRDHPHLHFEVARAPTIPRGMLERRAAGLPLAIWEGGAPALLGRSLLALATSGTVTLEAAVAGVPMVVVYRTSPLTWSLGRRWVRDLPGVALPNLLAGTRVVPELLQHFSAADISAQAEPLLADSEPRRLMLQGLAQAVQRLGPPGATQRTALILRNFLEGR